MKRKSERIIKSFYVINFDVNRKKMVKYDIIPYLLQEYDSIKNKKDIPKTLDDVKAWIDSKAMYQWWSRCEYEIILSGWPYTDIQEKWDVYGQVKMNIDIISEIFFDIVN